jgi:hypothetical protein
MNCVANAITDHQQSNVVEFASDSILTEMVSRLAYSNITIHDLNDGVMAAEAMFRESSNRDLAIRAGMAIALKNVRL